MHAKRDALCEQWWPSQQHPGKKSRHMLYLLCHQGPLITVCFAAGLRSHVPLTRLPLTSQHCQAQLLWCRERHDWKVKWCSVVFSDESRLCLYVSDGCTRVRHRPGEHHLPECVCPWHDSLLTLCYLHLFDSKVMCFSAGQCTSTHGCYDATCSLWCTTVLTSKIPRSLTSWSCMGHDEAGTYSFSRACYNHCQIVIMGERYLGQSIAGWHSAPLWPFACQNTRLRCR